MTTCPTGYLTPAGIAGAAGAAGAGGGIFGKDIAGPAGFLGMFDVHNRLYAGVTRAIQTRRIVALHQKRKSLTHPHCSSAKAGLFCADDIC